MDALANEVMDDRTWETQYQMVMALAECGYTPALEWLRDFARSLDDPLMLVVGVGDAVVRLSILVGATDAAIRWALATGSASIADGAFRALAVTRTVPGAAVISDIFDYLRPLHAEDQRRFWVATAAVDWKGADVESVLQSWTSLPRDDVAEAARASLAGEYKRRRPL